MHPLIIFRNFIACLCVYVWYSSVWRHACILNQQKHQPYFHRIPALKCTTKTQKLLLISPTTATPTTITVHYSRILLPKLWVVGSFTLFLYDTSTFRSWSFFGSEWMSACSCMRCFWFSFMCVRFNRIAGWAYSLILMYGYCGMYGSMVLHTHRYWVCSWPGMWYGCHSVHHKDCQYMYIISCVYYSRVCTQLQCAQSLSFTHIFSFYVIFGPVCVRVCVLV